MRVNCEHPTTSHHREIFALLFHLVVVEWVLLIATVECQESSSSHNNSLIFMVLLMPQMKSSLLLRTIMPYWYTWLVFKFTYLSFYAVVVASTPMQGGPIAPLEIRRFACDFCELVCFRAHWKYRSIYICRTIILSHLSKVHDGLLYGDERRSGRNSIHLTHVYRAP